MSSWFRRLPIPPLALLALAACSPPSTPIEPHLDALGPTRAAPGTLLEARGTFTPATRLEVCATPLDAPRFATEDGTVVSAADAPAPSYPRLLGRVPALAPETACAVRLVVDGVPREPVEGVRFMVAPPPTLAPGAPSDLVATPRDGAAVIAFSPAGDAVTNHAYSLDDGATWTPLDPPDAASPVTVPDLTNGVPATIRLRAVNAAGAGAPSASVTVTPVGLPGSPTDLVVSPGDASLRATFTPPAATGLSITNYAWSVDDGATWTPLDPPDAAPPVTVSGLDDGTTYALRLRAVTPAGPGAASAAVRGTPRTTPGAPTALAAWPEVADADAGLPERTVLRFDPPADGGAPIVRYEARRRPADGGAWTAWSAVDALAASPTGPRGRRVAATDALPDWDDHVVEVRAVNAAGPGPAAAVDPVTRALVLRGTISPGDVNAKTRAVFALPVSPADVAVAWPDGVVDLSGKGGPVVNGRRVGVLDGSVPSEPVPYELRIEGPLDAFGDGQAWDGPGRGAQTVEAVVSWGATGATSLDGAAFGATHLTTVPTWLPATVRDLSNLFHDAAAFDQDLGGWDTSNVTDLTRAFAGATAFRAGVAAWDVGQVTSTNATFEGATAFDEDLGAWDVANVVDFTSTFEGATAFDADLGAWDTGAARFMDGMFRDAASFDGDVGGWDVAGVQDLSSAFEGATAFDRDLGGWDVRSVLNMDGTFEGSGMSQAAYDATLVGWAAAIEGEVAAIRVQDARTFSPADAAVTRIYRADLEASGTTVSASTVVVLEAGHGLPFVALRAGEADDRFWVRLVTDDPSVTDVYLNVGPPDTFAADRTRELALPLGLQDAESLTHDDVRGRVVPLPVEGVNLGAPPHPVQGVTPDVMRPSTPEAQAACDALVDGLDWTIGGLSTTDVACRPAPG